MTTMLRLLILVFGLSAAINKASAEIKIICEDHSDFPEGKNVSCAGNEVISVIDAYYGRTSWHNCIDYVRWDSIQNIQCRCNNSCVKNITDACHCQSSCQLYPSNNVFGDPCFGIYKYINITYTCKSREEIISDSVRYESTNAETINGTTTSTTKSLELSADIEYSSTKSTEMSGDIEYSSTKSVELSGDIEYSSTKSTEMSGDFEHSTIPFKSETGGLSTATSAGSSVKSAKKYFFFVFFLCIYCFDVVN